MSTYLLIINLQTLLKQLEKDIKSFDSSREGRLKQLEKEVEKKKLTCLSQERYGERRANGTINYRIANGAGRSQIEVVSYGEECPAQFGKMVHSSYRCV